MFLIANFATCLSVIGIIGCYFQFFFEKSDKNRFFRLITIPKFRFSLLLGLGWQLSTNQNEWPISLAGGSSEPSPGHT